MAALHNGAQPTLLNWPESWPEETLPGFVAVGWQCVVAPIGTPQVIVTKISEDLRIGGKADAAFVPARLAVAPAERSLHLAARAHGRIVGIEVDVGPFQPLALGDVALELDVLREAEREIAPVERDARPASACPRRRSRPRRPAPRPASGCAWRWRRRRSESPWARRSAPGAAPRSRPRCRARARSCGSAGRARRNGRSDPAAWRIP